MADTPDIGEIIGKLTEDPETLGKVMSLASSLMGSIPQDGTSNTAVNMQEAKDNESQSSDGENQKLSFDPNMLPALLSSLGGIGGGDKKERGSQKGDSRAALLMALKPYMSDERAEKIDMMIKAMKLADIAGGLLGNGGLFS